jgi:hypothetical protein
VDRVCPQNMCFLIALKNGPYRWGWGFGVGGGAVGPAVGGWGNGGCAAWGGDAMGRGWWGGVWRSRTVQADRPKWRVGDLLPRSWAPGPGVVQGGFLSEGFTVACPPNRTGVFGSGRDVF